ncbi:MAG: LysM peptidoglycan-binding domain-containing protein, partial [Chloroflexi bacterium]|nr:LysM peptidoglycan-binding domain-containing protein [Chloroflexota bacterium]
LLVFVITACGGDDDPARETREPTVQPTTEIAEIPSSTPTVTFTPGGPTLTPSSTFPPTTTPRATDTLVPEATAVPPTEVPAPYIHTVVDGDTCGGIAVQYGLELIGGAAAIERANNINCRTLQLGQQLTIPRATGTPTPQGFDVTQTAIATALPPSLRNFRPALYEYCPVEDDTLTSIALKAGTTQQRICELNPLPDGIDCSGCDFSESAAVGFCPVPPLISQFNCLQVPGPTFTPTFTPTFSGSETVTPTPTFAPPRLLQPASGATMPGSVMLLVWLSSGELKTDEYYQISITNETSGATLFDIVSNNSYLIPSTWQPPAGESHTIRWKVEVVRRSSEGLNEPISGQAMESTFVWQG